MKIVHNKKKAKQAMALETVITTEKKALEVFK